mgnify:CR=1 FL=1
MTKTTGKTDKSEKLKFLNKLENKLHSFGEVYNTLGGRMNRHTVDDYTQEKMNSGEIEKLLKIVEEGDYVFFPKGDGLGFYPCFSLISFNQNFPGAPIDKKHLLSFGVHQLPKGYNFKKLSKYFMNEKNLERAELAEVKFVKEEGYYWY